MKLLLSKADTQIGPKFETICVSELYEDYKKHFNIMCAASVHATRK